MSLFATNKLIAITSTLNNLCNGGTLGREASFTRCSLQRMFKQSGYRKRAVYGSTAAVVLDHTDLKEHDDQRFLLVWHDKYGFYRVLAQVELLAQFTHTASFSQSHISFLEQAHTASLSHCLTLVTSLSQWQHTASHSQWHIRYLKHDPRCGGAHPRLAPAGGE